jgi:hypothetical protein
MITRKHLLLAIAATCLVTMFLISIVPIRSQTAGQYDPWLDVNDDGKIDGKDIALPSLSFGTAGDPTKPVNVTTIPAATIEQDLNVSRGSFQSNIFSTEGYDRLFVSAAITDISNHSSIYTGVYLFGAYWYWGVVNGTYMKTYDPVDPNEQLRVDWYNSSHIPISSYESSEFAVKAPQCSLYFNVTTSLLDWTWILIRVSVYLTVGTTSPPSVQNTNTYVTNWPSMEPQPSFFEGWTPYDGLTTIITNGYGWNSTSVNVGGYSRMFIQIELTNASYQGVPITTTVILSSIDWGMGIENVPSSSLNASYYGSYLPVYSNMTPPEFKTKSSSCTLYFSINSQALSGWITFYVKVYLRNE